MNNTAYNNTPLCFVAIIGCPNGSGKIPLLKHPWNGIGFLGANLQKKDIPVAEAMARKYGAEPHTDYLAIAAIQRKFEDTFKIPLSKAGEIFPFTRSLGPLSTKRGRVEGHVAFLAADYRKLDVVNGKYNGMILVAPEQVPHHIRSAYAQNPTQARQNEAIWERYCNDVGLRWALNDPFGGPK